MGLGSRAEFKGLIRDTLYYNGTRNLGPGYWCISSGP